MKKLLIVWLASFASMASLPASDAAIKADEYIKNFAALYSSASSAAARRALCIKAIDDKVIENGVSIEVVDRMFGLNEHRDMIESSARFRRIHFEQLVPGMDATDGKYSSGYFPGWYLYVEIAGGKIVNNYYLSNISKLTARVQIPE